MTLASTVLMCAGSPKLPATKASKEHVNDPPTAISRDTVGQLLSDTAALPLSSRLPYTSSTSAVSVTPSSTVLSIVTVKVTVSPGSGTEAGEGLFVTSTLGSALVNSTMASSLSETELSSLSWASTVAVLLWSAPEASPVTTAVNTQLSVPPIGVDVRTAVRPDQRCVDGAGECAADRVIGACGASLQLVAEAPPIRSPSSPRRLPKRSSVKAVIVTGSTEVFRTRTV